MHIYGTAAAHRAYRSTGAHFIRAAAVARRAMSSSSLQTRCLPPWLLMALCCLLLLLLLVAAAAAGGNTSTTTTTTANSSTNTNTGSSSNSKDDNNPPNKTTKKVPAIIVFGDSSVDTGNNNFIPTVARSNFWPYGRDFAGGVPTGRFSNGRLATDFISEAFGLPPSIPAYLDANRSIEELATGVSFASAATGLDNATAGVLSVITLGQQLAYFEEYVGRLRAALGEAAAAEVLGGALYIWSIGTNDFIENYYGALPTPARRRARYTVGQYEAYLLGLAAAAIRRVHALGGRKMDFTGLTPMGCLPAERMGNSGECNEQYNAVARTFNAKLRELVARLNAELPGLQLVYADTYQLLADVVSKPGDYGFDNAVQGCCGTGLFEAGYFCSLSTSMLCGDANKYVFFDAIHPTEKLYKLLADNVINTTLHVFM